MLEFDVRGDMRPILEDLDKVELQIVPVATVTALNNTGKHLVSVGKKEIAAAAGVPQKVIYSGGKSPRRKLALGKASRRRMSVPIYLKTKPLNPYSVSPARAKKEAKAAGGWLLPPGHVSKKTTGKAKGIVGTRTVKRGGNTFPRGLVLKRKGDARYPTQAVSIPLTGAAGIMQRLTNGSGPYFSKEFDRQMKRRLAMRSRAAYREDLLASGIDMEMGFDV